MPGSATEPKCPNEPSGLRCPRDAMRVSPNSQMALAAAVWTAGGASLSGFLLIAWFFYWASQHDSGDGVDSPYPVELTHGVLGALVMGALLAAWMVRRSGSLRAVHLLPLIVAGGYASMVLYFAVLSLL